MRLSSSRRIHRRYAALPLLSAQIILVSCSDAPHQPVPAAEHPVAPSFQVYVDEHENSWNYYSADITIVREAGYYESGHYLPQTANSYGVQRTLSGGIWDLEVAHVPYQPNADGVVLPPETDIARVETDAFATYVRAFDRTGTQRFADPGDLGSYAGSPLPPGADTVPPYPAPPPPYNHSVSLPGSTPSTDSAVTRSPRLAQASALVSTNAAGQREWLDEIVITARSRERVRARMHAGFGPPVSTVGVLERYVRRSGQLTIEHLVDPSHGATVEENIAVSGVLQLHLRRRYQQTSGGRLVLSSIRFEQRGADGRVLPAMEYRINNIRVEARGQ